MNKNFLVIGLSTSLLSSPSYGQKPAPRPAVTWYKVMTGTIDTRPVTVYLFRTGNQIEGHYYFDKPGDPVWIDGKLSGENLEPDTNDETFRGKLTDSAFIGSFKSGSKRLPVRLHIADASMGFIPFTYVWVKGIQKRLHPSRQFPDGPSYEATIIWPKDSTALSGFLRNEIFDILRFNWQGKHNLTQALMKDKVAFLRESNDDAEVGPSYVEYKRLIVQYQDRRLLDLASLVYNEDGGLHASHETVYYCYDLVHERRITMTDIIDTPGYGQFLGRLLEAQYRKDHHMAPNARLSDTLYEDIIPLTDNFYLTSKGIGFLYNEYEIAPYTEGEQSIFLSYKELMPYLRPEFKKWMGLK